MTDLVYDSIYLSPHLDDVALSCGGQIFALTEAGKKVLIVNVMAGDPGEGAMSDFARTLHERWQLERDAAAARREEDARACQILGADAIYWPLPDCIYRIDGTESHALYNSNSDIFGHVRAEDASVIKQVVHWIDALPGHKRLIAPLGVGNHVDHQITRMAAERSRSADDLLFYEDFPYAAISGAIESLTQEGHVVWCPMTIPLSESALQAKIEAIAAYHSQISTLFGNQAGMEKVVRHYCEVAAGERLWSRREPC